MIFKPYGDGRSSLEYGCLETSTELLSLSIHVSMHVTVPHNPQSASRFGQVTVHGQEETPTLLEPPLSGETEPEYHVMQPCMTLLGC
jgi:hypothetical protein